MGRERELESFLDALVPRRARYNLKMSWRAARCEHLVDWSVQRDAYAVPPVTAAFDAARDAIAAIALLDAFNRAFAP